MQDPDDFLKEQRLSFKDPIDPAQDAVIDVAHRTRIGNDWFYFATRETREQFLHDPFRWATLLSDPVDHTASPTKSSPKAQRAGIEFRFASNATRAAFTAAPDSFYHARGQMLLGRFHSHERCASPPGSTPASVRTGRRVVDVARGLVTRIEQVRHRAVTSVACCRTGRAG